MDRPSEPIPCGVLFCGGCNPYFDRLALYRALVRELEGEFSFFFYEEGADCRLILLINGCTTECLMGRSYPRPLVVVNSGGVEQAAARLRQAARENA